MIRLARRLLAAANKALDWIAEGMITDTVINGRKIRSIRPMGPMHDDLITGHAGPTVIRVDMGPADPAEDAQP